MYVLMDRYELMFTDHFGGPGRAFGRLRVSVRLSDCPDDNFRTKRSLIYGVVGRLERI